MFSIGNSVEVTPMWWYVMSVIGQFLTSMSESMILRGRDRLVPRDYKKVYDPGKGHYVPISGEYTTVPEAVKILELRSQTAQIARAFPGTALEIMEVRTALRGR